MTYTKERKDVYQMITDRFIASLENNIIPWKKPWNIKGNLQNFATKTPYHGINILLLGMSNYTCPYWITFNQAKNLGGNIKKGEKGTIIVYWNFINITKDINTSSGEQETIEKTIPFLKYHTVFNLEQCEGIEIPQNEEKQDFNNIEKAESIINNYLNKPLIKEGNTDACYSPVLDKIMIPFRYDFHNEESFYSTLFHECVHSTGHNTRLDRPLKSTFGSDSYAIEELIAEIGASFLNYESNIFPIIEENMQAYIKGWLSKLKNDKTFIVKASGQAQKAVNYILNKN